MPCNRIKCRMAAARTAVSLFGAVRHIRIWGRRKLFQFAPPCLERAFLCSLSPHDRKIVHFHHGGPCHARRPPPPPERPVRRYPARVHVRGLGRSRHPASPLGARRRRAGDEDLGGGGAAALPRHAPAGGAAQARARGAGAGLALLRGAVGARRLHARGRLLDAPGGEEHGVHPHDRLARLPRLAGLPRAHHLGALPPGARGAHARPLARPAGGGGTGARRHAQRHDHRPLAGRQARRRRRPDEGGGRSRRLPRGIPARRSRDRRPVRPAGGGAPYAYTGHHPDDTVEPLPVDAVR